MSVTLSDSVKVIEISIKFKNVYLSTIKGGQSREGGGELHPSYFRNKSVA